MSVAVKSKEESGAKCGRLWGAGGFVVLLPPATLD